MRAPELAEMNAFVAVAEQRSFAKAAVQLGISRSRLSETIRGLEGRLGVRLLNRTTRSVAPTAAGERLLARMRPLLDDFAAVLELDQRIPRQAGRAAAPYRAAASGELHAGAAALHAFSRNTRRSIWRSPSMRR